MLLLWHRLTVIIFRKKLVKLPSFLVKNLRQISEKLKIHEIGHFLAIVFQRNLPQKFP